MQSPTGEVMAEQDKQTLRCFMRTVKTEQIRSRTGTTAITNLNRHNSAQT